MASIEDKQSNGEPDDLSFLRTEDYICLNCSVVTQNGISRRMALAAEAFGNKMCFLEDITLENVTPDFPACIFVLEQALSVRALQEFVNSSENSNINTIQQSGHRTLLYGHAVQLRHLHSNMYLTCLSTSTSNDKLAFDVGLQLNSQGESCWWTIHPASKQRSEGEKVRIGDDIILVSVASERYLHIYSVDNIIHRVNASFQQTLWTLLPISSGNFRSKTTGFVFGGDVLRLFHGNMDQCFTLPQPGVSEFPYSIFYETGSVCNHARSLWRLEFLRTRWYGGFMLWNSLVRFRHITSGRYLGITNGEVCVVHRDKANADVITFILTPVKDDKKSNEIESEETMGMPTIKYGDTLVYVQHAKTSHWLSYQTYETKKRGIGKIEEKKATLHEEGHMDDCFTIVRAQEEEARSALVIRKCMSLFTKFIRAMDTSADHHIEKHRYWKKISLEKVLKCLDDLIEFFKQPSEDISHEERQAKLKALRNRQDLFHEEGMITLVLDTIDKYSEYSETKNQTSKMNIQLFDGYKQHVIDEIYDQLYALLATMIKGNRNNCAQFAQGNRLDCLIGRLTSQQTSRGVLEVLHCILIDSPEALNMIKERHIQGIISLLDRNGRDPKVLAVLSSLCANNGIAVRLNQNLICENLLQRRDLLMQSRLIEQISCLRPNIMVGANQGESMYKKWYFEIEIDFVEALSDTKPHCRIGWASTEFHPTPDSADGFSCVGIGDDCYSYGFDGQSLWYSGRNKVINSEEFNSFKKGDVIGSLLDLSIPEIWFSLNGVPMKGFFREFNLSGMFYPVISVSPKISCRFLFGDEHGRFKFGPPEGCAPLYQAMLQKQKIRLEQCFSFGDMNKYIVQGPAQPLEQVAFTPNPVDTSNIQMPNFIDGVRDRLAENLHEIWAMNKIEQGWRYAEIRNDLKKFHNCLCQFEMLPIDEKQYDTNLATETLRTMFAMGYQILMDNKQDQKRLKLIKLSNAFLQINGYKPQPLDLNSVVLSLKLEELVEKLAQNTHNVWAKERIKNGWTYGVLENPIQKRHPYLLPYDKVDPSIKKANRETALDTVKTLLAYGYIIESPNLELEESIRKKKNDSNDVFNHRFTSRTYRAEKTYAIKSGKWYYEVEILTMGSIKIGWSEVNCMPITDISADPQSYSFDSLNAVKWHHTSDPFGKKCQPGDVIGVMIDLQDKTISFSLNGEVLMDSVGSESAFENISIGEGYIPAFSLGFGQKIRPNFGQDVNSLKFFTNCGLQEGYEPFAVNMTKHVTLWYTNELPVFEYIDNNHDTLEITRNIGSESLPYIKIVSKLFGTEKTKMEYLRLSIPIAFRDEFISRSKVREKRIQALYTYKSQTEDETENQPIFNFDQPDIDYKNDKSRSSTLERNLGQGQPNSSKPLSSLFNKITHKQHRSKSPFKFMNRLSREASPNISSNQNIKSLTKNDKNSASKSKISRSTEFGIKSSLVNHVTNPLPKTSTLQKEVYSGKSQAQLEDLIEAELDQHLAETDEGELQAIIDYVDEYYYGVRIFPGQDATKVFVGWTGSRFHLLNEKMDKNFDHGLVSKCTLINTSNDGSIVSSLVRKECYVVSAAELIQNSTQPDTQLSKKIANSILLGCLIELSTGFLTFTVNGKETVHKFQVEPGTKLYPAVFVEPTTKEILQIELGRVRNCLPLSAALFPSLGKHIEPRLPPRLRIQYLKSIRWSRVPNSNLKVHCLKMNNILGWSLLCEETVYNQAIYIPERDRWISVLELNENEKYREFFHNLLMLYEAICAQSNNYVAHQLCNQIDEKQLMYCIQNSYLNGQIRRRFYDLLIKLHLESFAVSRQMTKYEFVIPLNSKLFSNKLVDHKELMKNGKLPKRDDFVSVRPSIISESQIKNETQKLYLVPPSFNIEALKQFVLNSFPDSVKLCISHVRDPTGGSNSFLFVPLIKLLNQLLVMDVFSEEDLHLLMAYLDPTKFISESVSIPEGLLSANLEDEIKYEICLFLHSLCDYVLRFRVEAVVSFSSNYVNEIQCDQKKRYNELKESSLPSALMAKKTKEFRCPAKDQMQSLVNFKSSSHHIDLSEDIKNKLTDFHLSLNEICQIKQRDEHKVSDNQVDGSGFVSKIVKVLFSSEYSAIENQEQMEPTQENLIAICEEASQNGNSHNALSLLITENVVDWAKNSFINNEDLIREMFGLIYRQYNSLGELAECLPKTYVIAETSIKDVTNLLQSLSIVRGLLSVQMSQIEEDIMKSCLNEIMDNKIFFQHPDLMRALCVHETVMQVMINWLNRRQHQQDVVGDMMTNLDNQESVINSNQLTTSQQGDEQPKEENAELVVVCCKFLSYFCRTSRHNQRAMFEHLSYLLDNSAMLLARPSLRGSCPLDVACSSLMDNNDLSLALRESDLEKIAAYLSRCGLQTNSELFTKGYPDIGWDPVEGERFLDFLKFCVWVNGDSVEENANLIVRLLIRRPECLGPALRGEGGGLLKATIDGIRMSLQIAATQNVQNPVVMATALDAESEMSIDFLNNNKFDFSRIPPEDDEDYIDIGEAILSFYASLVELLGRCAPSEETIKMGKSDSIRARSILRSLVSMEDLEGFLSLRFILPIPGLSEHLPGIQSSHKMSIVLFLERVYGIPDQTTFFRLLETGFLPDIRCATILDSSTCAEGDMPLALNRYLCCSVLPLLTSYAHYFDAAENKASLMETVLNTVYRLSKCKSLTNGQLDVVCEFLISFTNQMKPPMMKNLLKKLIEDLPTLEEYTIVPLKMLTLWYERCGRYYGASPIGQATEEEKKLTMTLFTRIFDSLARRTYDPELFSKALPCLSAIGCALSPDYSYTVSESDPLNYQSGSESFEMQRSSHFKPIPLNISNIILTQDFEDVIKIYSEHVHDLWSYNKFDQNWSYGQSYSDSERLHPSLKNYQNMSKKEQLKYEDLTRDTLKAIKVLGWSIEKSETVPNNLKNASRMVLKKLKDGVVSNGYMPKPFDLSSITLTKEQDDLANTLAVNCHHIWSRKKKNELENVGAALHHLLVPYELLTDRERASDLQFSFGLVKFLILNGYRLQNIESSLNEKRLALNTMHHDESDKGNHDRTEIRFAFNLLEKLLEYVDKAALNMQSIKESAKFSRKSSFKTSGGDVKFFTKVVLPLIEKYFQSHRSYFILKSSSNKPGLGCATAKEKEMTCSLFCKLALLLRKKMSCFGSDTNITVRCLQVLIRAVDVSSVIKNSQEIVRASLLPFFSYAADDLSSIIDDLTNNRLSNIKGTSQKTSASLDYIHMVLLPVLASMFDHLGVNKYGTDVLTGEIQLASYKILNALWILGTLGTKLVDREWIVTDLSRHRPLIGECLGSFATSFPIAFLEPEFNLNNKYSIMYGLTESNLSEHSLEAQDVMAKLSKNLPLLEDIISEVGNLCESGGKYEDAPHVIEILLPTLCSYLHYWWDHGPSAKLSIESTIATATTTQKKPETSGETSAITGVTSQIMNKTLGYILKLISNNLDEKEAAWMNRIASFSQLIIANSTSDLLEDNFLPVSGLIAHKARDLYHKELSIRTHSKNAAQRENIESDVQRQLEIIIRNIYAFYPLLIKYVDLHRAYWLKNPDEMSQQLYYHVAEVFTIWLKSKMFKREEINFVSANNIDNMILIMPNKVSGLSSSANFDPTSSKTKKKRAKSQKSQTKKFTSLIVAGLKRLFQLGINFFEGKEQELIQMAKQKFIDIKTGLLSETLMINGKKVSTASTSSQEDTLNLELNKDQEDIVADFIGRYLKSSHSTSKDDTSINDTIDKETYQKTKWQRVLYRKIASKRHLISTMRNLSQESIVEKIMEIAKVLYGLHMVEHPQTKTKGIWRKLISGQRKKAVMACFRMAPLYSLPQHRAINLFLKSYRQNWLDIEAENETDIGCLVPDLCPKMAKVDELEAGEDAVNGTDAAVQVVRPDPLTQLIACFNRAATTQQTGAHGSANLADDQLYQMFADKMSKSCEIVDEDEDEDEAVVVEEQAPSDDDQSSAFQLAEMQKQKLLFEQDRLAERGAAQMCLLYISASRGEKTQMLEKTLELGISLLHGGNVHVQQRMLKHLRDKKDVGFFTSLSGLMANCSVLDLDTFERCIKAEQFGGLTASDSDSGMAGKKNLHDADFTCALFRFLQLLCEGHNLEFQNYLRAQSGNNTTVNIIICTVDYLLRLQESLMDFYWHYSGKSSVDAAGKDNFCRAINVAKQVFNTLTEYIQGPCVGNQLTLAHSRLWDAIGGFLYIFANLQDKLSKDPHQIELLRELMKLQKDMIIMLLSMLEGNVLNGPIGKQMVDTLIENQQNVEMLLKFFDIFLKMKDLTTSEAFQEFDSNGDGWISPKEFRRAMEAQKMYSCEEIDYILMCVDTNQDGKIDFNEFTERFHNPAKDIGFNMAVLLTNLSEHMSHEARFERLMKKASSFLSYFEPFLGRIEITGSSGRIERVYFEIKESNIEQWNKPQIKESKRQFLYDIVNEGDDKEKLEQFVNFCEDTIFEMQHAASISSSGEDECQSQDGNKQSVLKTAFQMLKTGLVYSVDALSPNRLKTLFGKVGNMSKMEVVKWCAQIGFSGAVFLVALLFHLVCLVFKCVYLMVRGQSETKSDERRMSVDGKSRRTEEVVEERQSRRELELVDEKEECESGENGESRAVVLRDEDDEIIVPKSGPVSSPSSSNGKKILAMFARNFYKLKYLALILAFLINFLMLFYKAKKLNSDTMAELADDADIDETNLIEVIMVDQDEYYIEHLLKSLAFVHSLVAFGIMVAYYVLKVPLVIFKREKEIARKLEFQGLWIAEQPDDDDLKSHWDKLVLGTRSFPDMYWDKFIKKKVKSKYAEQFDMQQLNKLLGIDAKFDEYNFDEASKAAGQNAQNANESKGLISRLNSIDWKYQIWKWGVIFTDNSFLYVFWYFCFSVIGNFNYFFFACHLSDVAISIKTLTTILKSITHNGKQLLLTIMLMSIVVYMYTVIAFNFFRKFYSKEEDGELEENCQDLFTCFKFHLYIGIRSGGGIGDELESPVGDDKEFYRIIFDITFFFFIIVILLAIIQGLIIDAFGELRDQLEQVKESLEANCFICGIGKEYFDKVPHGFEIHTMREHNFANYMFFLMHLINKPDTEYTGQETYVSQLYQQRCWEFFPTGDCFRKQHEGDLEQN